MRLAQPVAEPRKGKFTVSVRDRQGPPNAARGKGFGRADFVPGTRLATSLMGDSIATNLFMIGYAYQKGLLPVSADSIFKAIEMNGVAVDFNKQAFLWGRQIKLAQPQL